MRAYRDHVSDGRPVPDPAAVVTAVLDSLDTGVAVVDADGVVVLVSAGLARVLGEVRYVVGEPEPSVDDRLAVPVAPDGGIRLSRLDATPVQLRYGIGDRLRWLEARVRPLDVAGIPLRVLVVEDVTEAREAADARDGAIAVQRQLARQLELTNAQQVEANAQLERFAGALAHDLKAPLANVSSFAELLPDLLGDHASPDATMASARLLANARRASAMVSDLLDYARTAGGDLDRAPVPLGRVVATALDELAGAVADHGAAVSVAPDLPVVHGNEAALERVLVNLVGNALRYRHPERPPVVDVRTGPAPTGMVALQVEDNGVGIPAESRDAVFELGTRLHDEESGSGIGLAACRVVAEAHGGTIRVLDDEPPGGGAVVELTLPLVPTRSQLPVGGTVMVIDDDPDVAAVVRLSGRQLGVELVAEVTDGRRAVEVYDALDEPPAVVVLDLVLPGIDGLLVAARIHERDPGQRIVLHSSHLDEAVRLVANDAGVSACVSKGSGQLVDVLAQLLAGHPG